MHPLILRPKALFSRTDCRSKFLTYALHYSTIIYTKKLSLYSLLFESGIWIWAANNLRFRLCLSVVCCLIQDYISPPQIKQGMFYPKYTTLQSLTGKYRGLQGNSCNKNRDPVMKTGFSLWELTHRKFSALQSLPVMKTGFSLRSFLYRENPLVMKTGFSL